MPPQPDLTWQPSLFDTETPSFDDSFAGVERIDLDPTSWIDYARGWVQGSDRLFEEVLEARNWGQRARKMYDQ